MSNTIKALIAIVSIILIASAGFFILSKNRVPESTNTDVQSSVSSSSKAQTLSSSIVTKSTSLSIVANSIPQDTSKVTELPVVSKIIAPNSQNVQNPNCNLPDSQDLVKTEDGCFKYNLNYSFYKENKFTDEDLAINAINKLSLKDTLKKASLDYYKKVVKKFVSKNTEIILNNGFEISKGKYLLYLSMNDPDFFSKKGGNLQTGALPRYNAIYQLVEQEDGTWSYQFQEFIKDSNGKIINE